MAHERSCPVNLDSRCQDHRRLVKKGCARLLKRPRNWEGRFAGRGGLGYLNIRPKNGSVEREVYAVYHGRFIELAMAHVSEFFIVSRDGC